MVYDADRELKAPLEGAEIGQDGGDLRGGILVDAAMESDEGIEDEDPGLESLDCACQGALIFGGVELEKRGGDHLDVESLEIQLANAADPFEPGADDVEGVLGRVQEDPAGLLGLKTSETGTARGHRNRKFESEEGLVGFGLAAEDADSLIGPEALDEPSVVGSRGTEFMRGDDGKAFHARTWLFPRARSFFTGLKISR
jgi:hypothetical protein